MKFTKQTQYETDYWFNGIYKITVYTQAGTVEPYYHAYYLQHSCFNWGDFVGGKHAQDNKKLTFKQCVELCKEHAKDYKPTSRQVKQAEKARKTYTNDKAA